VFANLRQQIALDLRRHVRLVDQHLLEGAAAENLLAKLPEFPMFRKSYHGVIAIADWDHRIPSRQITIRIYAYYSPQSASRGEREYAMRNKAIAEKNLYPEFDVPDYVDLMSDESYELDVSIDGNIIESRFTASWRRDVEPKEGDKAIAIVFDSPEHLETLAQEGERPPDLGGIEAFAWGPPF